MGDLIVPFTKERVNARFSNELMCLQLEQGMTFKRVKKIYFYSNILVKP